MEDDDVAAVVNGSEYQYFKYCLQVSTMLSSLQALSFIHLIDRMILFGTCTCHKAFTFL